MVVIRDRIKEKKLTRTFRLRPDLWERVEQIAEERGESKTYILESLLEYALNAYDKEGRLKK